MLRKKIIILGGFAVGKTSLLKRYVSDEFSNDYLPTIGVNIKTKIITYNHQELEFVIWDIADVVTHNTIPVAYLRGTHAAVLVFDVARETSYNRIPEDLAGMKKIDPNIKVIIVGNKADLVEKQHLQKIEDSVDFEINLFTSALKNENVEQIFLLLAKKLI